MFQGTCNSCGKWGHRKRECPTAVQGTQRQVAAVQPWEEKPLIFTIPPEEIENHGQHVEHDDMNVEFNNSQVEEQEEKGIDGVLQEAVSLNETGLARMQHNALREVIDEEISEALVALREPVTTPSTIATMTTTTTTTTGEDLEPYVGQDRDPSWMPDFRDYPALGGEATSACSQSAVMPAEPSVMALEAGDTALLMVDSGAYLHVCPVDFALSSGLMSMGQSVGAVSASGRPLKVYGRRAARCRTAEGVEMEITFHVMSVTRPILSVAAMHGGPWTSAGATSRSSHADRARPCDGIGGER